MIADRIKYIADVFLGLTAYGGADKNYKQLPLPLAILICVIGILIIGLIFLAVGVVVANYF